MQFIYEDNPQNSMIITGDNYKYLFKVRRLKVNDEVNITNFNGIIYKYKITNISKKEAEIFKIDEFEIKQKLKPFHLGWCKIDTKNIEKVLPTLNEIGVTKITFIECDRSQRNFKIKLDRIEKILINSNQQCGRVEMMKIEFCESLDKFLENNPNAKVLDFGGEKISEYFQTAVVGCEGGFSDRERKLFKNKYSFDTNLILRSESAVVAVASKVLL
jgi:16S rRNA (uracil1498-N3)-methyltransferase